MFSDTKNVCSCRPVQCDTNSINMAAHRGSYWLRIGDGDLDISPKQFSPHKNVHTLYNSGQTSYIYMKGTKVQNPLRILLQGYVYMYVYNHAVGVVVVSVVALIVVNDKPCGHITHAYFICIYTQSVC